MTTDEQTHGSLLLFINTDVPKKQEADQFVNFEDIYSKANYFCLQYNSNFHKNEKDDNLYKDLLTCMNAIVKAEEENASNTKSDSRKIRAYYNKIKALINIIILMNSRREDYSEFLNEIAKSAIRNSDIWRLEEYFLDNCLQPKAKE